MLDDHPNIKAYYIVKDIRTWGLYCYAEGLREKPRRPPSVDSLYVDGAGYVNYSLNS